MQAVAFEEIRNIAEYELERETFRPRVLAAKELRRIRVGNHLTFLFENRDTVRYQIQEMMRIERIVREHDIRHEFQTYNEPISGPCELSAALLLEYDTPEERSVWLRDLLGLENQVWAQIGNLPPTRARFDTVRYAPDRHRSYFERAVRQVPGSHRGSEADPGWRPDFCRVDDAHGRASGRASGRRGIISLHARLAATSALSPVRGSVDRRADPDEPNPGQRSMVQGQPAYSYAKQRWRLDTA